MVSHRYWTQMGLRRTKLTIKSDDYSIGSCGIGERFNLVAEIQRNKSYGTIATRSYPFS